MTRRSAGVIISEENFDKIGFNVKNDSDVDKSFLKGMLLNEKSLDIIEQTIEQINDIGTEDK